MSTSIANLLSVRLGDSGFPGSWTGRSASGLEPDILTPMRMHRATSPHANANRQTGPRERRLPKAHNALPGLSLLADTVVVVILVVPDIYGNPERRRHDLYADCQNCLRPTVTVHA